VKAFLSFYKNNAGDFPNEVRDRAYEAQLLAAYPVHPELFRILQSDWSGFFDLRPRIRKNTRRRKPASDLGHALGERG
jgi:predicted AAA+ superfamily ATPase